MRVVVLPLKYSTEGFDFRSVSAGRTAQKTCDVGSGLNATLCFKSFEW